MRTLLERILAEPLWRKILWVANLLLPVCALITTLQLETSLIFLPVLIGVFGGFFLLGGMVFSTFITTLLLMSFYGLTVLKYTISGFGLVYADRYLVGGNIVDLFLLDWRVQILTGATAILLIVEMLFLISLFQFRRTNLSWGLLLLILASSLVPISHTAAGKPQASGDKHDREWALGIQPNLSSFVASMASPTPSTQTEPRADWAKGSAFLKDQEFVTVLPARTVNLFLILYESTFDPLYLPAAELPIRASELLRPATGMHGPLLVPAYGGGTWLTEFALMTGQSPHAYGANAYNLNISLDGRLTGGLAHGLIASNFNFKVIYPFPGYFINAGSFYKSMGAHFVEPNLQEFTDFRHGFNDDLLFNRAIEQLDANGSNIQLIVTMLNHGPHRLADPFEDFWERLEIQESKLLGFKARLAGLYPDSENYILSFGDHHPLFTNQYNLTETARHTTFWSLDCLGRCDKMMRMALIQNPIGVEFILTEVLKALNLPTAPIARAQAKLLARGCYSLDYGGCDPADLHAFNWLFERSSIR